MKAQKRKRLEKAGWKLGSAKEFLGLTAEEEAVVDLKLVLARAVRKERSKRSEERRVGKECRSRWARYHKKKKRKMTDSRAEDTYLAKLSCTIRVTEVGLV